MKMKDLFIIHVLKVFIKIMNVNLHIQHVIQETLVIHSFMDTYLIVFHHVLPNIHRTVIHVKMMQKLAYHAILRNNIILICCFLSILYQMYEIKLKVFSNNYIFSLSKIFTVSTHVEYCIIFFLTIHSFGVLILPILVISFS